MDTNQYKPILFANHHTVPITVDRHNFTQCTTGGTDLGNLLQGGEAYVKFFAENTHFQGRPDCAPENQSNTPRQ